MKIVVEKNWEEDRWLNTVRLHPENIPEILKSFLVGNKNLVEINVTKEELNRLISWCRSFEDWAYVTELSYACPLTFYYERDLAKRVFGIKTIEILGNRALVNDGEAEFWVDKEALNEKVLTQEVIGDDIANFYASWCEKANADNVP